jgi:hypothetical protein
MLELVMALALAGADQDAAAAPAASASLDRIRAALARTPALRVDAPPPPPATTYRVEIIEHPFFTEIPYEWNFATGGGFPSSAPSATPGAPPPLSHVAGGTDILPLFGKVKHAFAERAAQREVQQTVAEFCATHSCVLR